MPCMGGPRRAFGLTLLALALHLAATSEAYAATPLKGRPVAEVLREAAGPGLRIVFSDELVPASLLVDTEPSASEGPARLDEILRPHGLGLAAELEGALSLASPPGRGAPRQASVAPRPRRFSKPRRIT